MEDEQSAWKEFESHCLNKGLSNNRLQKLRSSYRQVKRGLNVSLDEADEDDIRDFVDRLHRDNFTKQSGGAYSGYSKRDIKKFLKQFYKWYDGDGWKFPDKVAWIQTGVSKDEKPEQKRVLDFDEVHQIAQAMPKAEYTGLIYLLFDSGFRIGEMQSVLKADLERDTSGEEPSWWIKCRESKTEPRRVPVALFPDEINEFVTSGYYKSLDERDNIMQTGYRAFLKQLKKDSEEILGEPITFHNLRHSSATYYAKALDGDVFQLCERYGWAYGSDEAKTYVRRSGINQERAKEKVVQNKLSETNERVRELQDQNDEFNRRLEKMEELVELIVDDIGEKQMLEILAKED